MAHDTVRPCGKKKTRLQEKKDADNINQICATAQKDKVDIMIHARCDIAQKDNKTVEEEERRTAETHRKMNPVDDVKDSETDREKSDSTPKEWKEHRNKNAKNAPKQAVMHEETYFMKCNLIHANQGYVLDCAMKEPKRSVGLSGVPLEYCHHHVCSAWTYGDSNSASGKCSSTDNKSTSQSSSSGKTGSATQASASLSPGLGPRSGGGSGDEGGDGNDGHRRRRTNLPADRMCTVEEEPGEKQDEEKNAWPEKYNKENETEQENEQCDHEDKMGHQEDENTEESQQGAIALTSEEAEGKSEGRTAVEEGLNKGKAERKTQCMTDDATVDWSAQQSENELVGREEPKIGKSSNNQKLKEHEGGASEKWVTTEKEDAEERPQHTEGATHCDNEQDVPSAIEFQTEAQNPEELQLNIASIKADTAISPQLDEPAHKADEMSGSYLSAPSDLSLHSTASESHTHDNCKNLDPETGVSNDTGLPSTLSSLQSDHKLFGQSRSVNTDSGLESGLQSYGISLPYYENVDSDHGEVKSEHSDTLSASTSSHKHVKPRTHLDRLTEREEQTSFVPGNDDSSDLPQDGRLVDIPQPSIPFERQQCRKKETTTIRMTGEDEQATSLYLGRGCCGKASDRRVEEAAAVHKRSDQSVPDVVQVDGPSCRPKRGVSVRKRHGPSKNAMEEGDINHVKPIQPVDNGQRSQFLASGRGHSNTSLSFPQVNVQYASSYMMLQVLQTLDPNDCSSQRRGYLHIDLQRSRKMLILFGEYEEGAQWVRVMPIGQGGQGKCHLCVDKNTDFKFVCKEVPKEQFNMSELPILLWTMGHPHIVTLYGFLYDTDNVYILQQYVEGNTLGYRMTHGTRLSLYECLYIVQAILEVLRDLAAMSHNLEGERQIGLLHGDIKGENIIINNRVPYWLTLIDFGLSKTGAVPPEENPQGTYSHLSPEVAQSLGYWLPTDVFAAMVVFVSMLLGEVPDERLRAPALLYRRGLGPPRHYESLPLPEVVRDFIARGLEPDPDARATAAELLEHSVFQLLDHDPNSAVFYRHIDVEPQPSVTVDLGEMTEAVSVLDNMTITSPDQVRELSWNGAVDFEPAANPEPQAGASVASAQPVATMERAHESLETFESMFGIKSQSYRSPNVSSGQRSPQPIRNRYDDITLPQRCTEQHSTVPYEFPSDAPHLSYLPHELNPVNKPFVDTREDRMRDTHLPPRQPPIPLVVEEFQESDSEDSDGDE